MIHNDDRIVCTSGQFRTLLTEKIKKIIKRSGFDREIQFKVDEVAVTVFLELKRSFSPYPVHKKPKPISYKLHIVPDTDEVKELIHLAIRIDSEDNSQIVIENEVFERRVGSAEIYPVIEDVRRIEIQFHKLAESVPCLDLEEDESQCDGSSVTQAWGGPVERRSQHLIHESACTII